MCRHCGVNVGEIHNSGCDKEVCPVCGKQLISCGHLGEVKRGKLPRIPYIQHVILCSVCGKLFPRFFKVDKDDWRKYVIPPLQRKVLCRTCYDRMKELFPDGWGKLGSD